jgi:hypothetical protein
MTLIWLGVLLVFGGVLQMVFQPIWRGRLSGRRRLAPSVRRWNRKDRAAASKSNQTGLGLCWSCSAALSCWPGQPSEPKPTSLTSRRVASASVLALCRFL